jgi:peptidoglycan/LPS O-acetylase OafA/YrhL
MNPPLILGLLCVLTGVFAAWALSNAVSERYFHTGRHANLDGLRGFLSLIMFICHASTWQQYLGDARWRTSESPLFILPGQTGIVIFFMLTGFLFAGKYLDSPKKNIDWVAVFCARIMRLYPAYLVAILVLFGITLATGLLGQHPIWPIDLSALIPWILFTVPGAPDVFNAADTRIVIAGVTWSLTFEWAFYFSLPILAPLMGTAISWRAILISGVFLILTLVWIPFHGLVYYMLGLGVVAAIIDRKTRLTHYLANPIAGIAALGILIFNGWLFNTTSYTAGSVSIIACAFLIFASGNSLFGFLTSKLIQILGLGTYSIYLLHGPILYVSLNVMQHFYPGFHLEHLWFWGMIALISPLLVCVSVSSFIFVEAPAIQSASGLSKRVKKFLRMP